MQIIGSERFAEELTADRLRALLAFPDRMASLFGFLSLHPYTVSKAQIGVRALKMARHSQEVLLKVVLSTTPPCLVTKDETDDSNSTALPWT